VLAALCCVSCAGAVASVAAPIYRQRAAAKPKTRAKARSAQPDLTAVLAPLIRDDGGHFAVAVDDLTTGSQDAYGGNQEFVTASIVKVDILVTLLYQAQEAGQALTPEDQDLATTMIENSDNDSASDLYYDVGGAEAIDDANRVCGLSETTAGTDGYWGLTTTTVDDQIRLLRVVFTRPSPLSSASQDYIQSLMSQVEADQQWGVTAAADPGTRFMVKNGWLPNPYLWEINSIGEVTHDGQRMLIAVLSDGNASEASGISLVEDVAKTAAGALTSS
jgi:beta-lactamase class A